MTALLLIAGGLLMLIAALGVLRLPDVYLRMSAATKAATLGVALVLLGAAWHFGSLALAGRALVTVFFVYLTAPVAAYRIGRAAWRTGVPPSEGTRIDAGEQGAHPETR
jgi:multicomponent Na+:H+ antiporter subunit G